MVTSLYLINQADEAFERWIIGKQYHQSFAKNSYRRVRNSLKITHSNIYGSIDLASFGNKNIFPLLLMF